MAYEQYGKIEATDINTGLIGPAAAAKRLNALWGTGFGNRGYGQYPILPDMNVGDPVLASHWKAINNLSQKIAAHEAKFVINPDGYFTPGSTINFDEGISKKIIDAIDDNRTSSFIQGNYNTTSMANSYGWFNKLTYTCTATFPNGDSARYFFNCGGQFALRTWQPGITSSNVVRKGIAQLATDVGTVYWSATTGGSTKTKLNTVDFAATTKIGGGGNTPEIISGTQDYFVPSTYSPSETPIIIFKQLVKNGISGYDASFISLGVYTKGDKGVNGANGNVIVFELVVDVAPLSLAMPSDGIVYFYTIPPAVGASNLDYQSWDIPSINITISAI